jgi:HKD family nuclease
VSIELILQGLTKRTHGEVLAEMFAPDIERVIISVAFVSQNGVEHIEPLLAAHADEITVYAGIRNEITSAQALKRLLEIGVSLYAVDTGSRSLLFHPKLYHVRAAGKVQLLVGSANLTLGGLNNNIEASLLQTLSLDDEASATFINELEASFDGLTAEHPGNVFEVTDEVAIDDLLNAGRLIDETAAASPPKPTKARAGSIDPTPRMNMQPKPVRGKANPTGSTTLGSGTFDDIDRVTYFRDDLFGHLDWTLNGTIETAPQEFDLVIKGVLVGTFDLTLRHSLTRAAAAAADHNSPTSLSWNEARPLVAREDLLDRTMRIWRSTVDPDEFQVEID